MPNSSQSAPRPSYSSSMTLTNSSDGSRWANKKENQFIMQNGSKLHAYGRDKAPYPFSYNREVLELFCIDHALILQAKQAISFIDFKDNIPKRCLDIGTGLGDWVIDAAKHWPDCTFVGYDLVNVQIPLHCVDSSIAHRVEWVHGNILRQKLPFDDDEFDHIHIQGMAFAVPENKWPSVFEEVNRVLRQGGTVEDIEEDAMFPVLPRWFTAPLHAQARSPSAHFPDGSQRSMLPSPTLETFTHDHALLEKLFTSVFENRFISPVPSSVLPGYFSAVFCHVLLPPVLNFPMPPFAPLTPLYDQLDQPSSSESSEPSSSLLLPDPPINPPQPSSSASSVLATVDSTSTSTSAHHSSPSEISQPNSRDRRQSTSTNGSDSSGSASSSSTRSSTQRRSMATFTSPDQTTRIGGESVLELFPMEELAALEEHSLFMQLYRAVGLVLAAKEAMWDDLMDIVAKGESCLKDYGWSDEDYVPDVSRQKFEALIERYKGDMHVRIALWHSLTKHGWPYPQRDPLSKAELIEEERLRRAIMEARKCATEEELQMPSRSLRLLVGMKSV